MAWNKLSWLLPGLMVLAGCEYFQMKGTDEEEEPKEQPIARVDDTFLYPSDVEGLTPVGTPPEDSANIMERYVNGWIKKQLMIREAAANFNFDEAELERKILDYRYALMVYEYQKLEVDDQMDREVTEAEIREYFEANRDNFPLKQNIVKGQFVKLPKAAPQIRAFRRQFRGNSQSDRDEVRSYCFKYSDSFYLEDSSWVNLDELIKGSPWNSVQDKVEFMQNTTVLEEEDDDYYYFLKITEYKISDELSPLEFVRDQIRQIILNRRKVKLTQQLEQLVYEKAKESNTFEIYSRE